MVNPLHNRGHVDEYIDRISMSNLAVYIERDANGNLRLHDKMLVLTMEGDIVLHQCCLIYLGYVLHKLEQEELRSYGINVDEKSLLELFNAILPAGEKAIQKNDEEVYIVQSYTIEFAIGLKNSSELALQKCEYRVGHSLAQLKGSFWNSRNYEY